MTDFLVKRFVKDYEDTEKVSVRTAYGVLASVTGIFCNVLLFLVKGSIGLMLHSLSVVFTLAPARACRNRSSGLPF